MIRTFLTVVVALAMFSALVTAGDKSQKNTAPVTIDHSIIRQDVDKQTQMNQDLLRKRIEELEKKVEKLEKERQFRAIPLS